MGKAQVNVATSGMKWSIISESDAPAFVAPKGQVSGPNPNQVLGENLLSQLVEGKVARVGLDEGDNVRAIKRGITTVANRQGKSVVMWVDGDALYVKLDGAAKPKVKAKAKA
jgi:uncharacterized protein YheU (UPF0270 family)